MEKIYNYDKTSGYIEGYYGKLLSWNCRRLIVKSLRKNKMNTYFYAPKEDIYNRLNWRQKYSLKWRENFREFAAFCKKNRINIIAGIAPGLDFDFKEFNSANKNQSLDFNLLYEKAKIFLEDGASSIALLLDDIPDEYLKKFGKKIPEGISHGELANKLSKKLNQKIYFVPRIYADELIKDAPEYLNNLSKIINPKIIVFYCGANIVAKKLTNYSHINNILPNKIIYWDNFYANDYCPRRIFIGPYLGRANLNNIMINPTGLINTDLLLLDIIGKSLSTTITKQEWLKILHSHGVPLIFNKIRNFFLKPDFGASPKISLFDVDNKHFEALEFLLWKWKGELSREWYPYLFGLKHDLQLKKNILTSERLIKTQTSPLAQYLNKNLSEGESK